MSSEQQKLNMTPESEHSETVKTQQMLKGQTGQAKATQLLRAEFTFKNLFLSNFLGCVLILVADGCLLQVDCRRDSPSQHAWSRTVAAVAQLKSEQ